MAYLVASKSKDDSSKIGSVLVRDRAVLSVGYNGIVRGCLDNIKERNERPLKYAFYEHSERNSIYLAARNGIQTIHAELYTLSIPCEDCTRAVIQSGVDRIVYHVQHNYIFEQENPKWAESIKNSLKMFEESQTLCIGYNQIFGLKTLINGKIFDV